MKTNILCCAHICFCLLSVSERDTNATLRWGQSKTEEGKQSKDEMWSSRGATSSKSRHGTANINYPILLVKASFFLIKEYTLKDAAIFELRNWDLKLNWRLPCKCNFDGSPGSYCDKFDNHWTNAENVIMHLNNISIICTTNFCQNKQIYLMFDYS